MNLQTYGANDDAVPIRDDEVPEMSLDVFRETRFAEESEYSRTIIEYCLAEQKRL